MSRRGTYPGDMFARVVKAETEYKRGRIHFIPSGYEFGTESAFNRNGIELPARPDADGQMARLNFKEAASNCEAAELWQGVYPVFVRNGKRQYWVPKSKCIKCKYYSKRRHGKPFASCDHLVNIRSAEPDALVKVKGMVGDAITKAKEMVGERR